MAELNSQTAKGLNALPEKGQGQPFTIVTLILSGKKDAVKRIMNTSDMSGKREAPLMIWNSRTWTFWQTISTVQKETA